MTDDTATCMECRSPINPDATRCPECGYAPQEIGAWSRRVRSFVAAVLLLSVVGSPIGLLMLAGLWWEKRKVEQRTAAGYER